MLKKLPGEIGDESRNDKPEQAFNQKKHKSRDAEAFHPSDGGAFSFFLRFLHHLKNNFFTRIFQTIFLKVWLNYEKTFSGIYRAHFLFYSFFVPELRTGRAAES